MRIVVAEHHPLFRDGLVAFLVASGQDVVAAVATGCGALEKARTLQPDVVLLDIGVEQPDGVTTACLLAAEEPQLPILTLGVTGDDPELLRAVASGCRGYLLKGADPRETLEAIDRAADGDAVLSKELARFLLGELGVPRSDGVATDREVLSREEEEYLRSVVFGVTSSDNGAGRVQRVGILGKLHRNHRPRVLDLAASYRKGG